MAQKRMFSLSVVDTDKFLEMPVSSRLLYYELGMRADDDGFVDNWKKILMFTGLKEDDMKLLITKQFVIPFESGVIVIRHWRLNNYLQNDRTKPTIYQQELKQLELDNNNVYTLDTKCIHSIDKNSIVKNSIDNNIYCVEFEELWKQYPKKVGKQDALKHYTNARKSGTTFEEVQEGLKKYLEYCENTKWYSPKDGSTWFHKKSWNDVFEQTTSLKQETEEEWFERMEREAKEKENEYKRS